METKICITCGKEFQKYSATSNSAWSLRLYCSMGCVPRELQYGRSGYKPMVQFMNDKSRKIARYTKEGVFIDEFESLVAAARKLGSASGSDISACARGKLPHAKGYIWKYVD